MIDTGYLYSNDDKRLFVNTSLGCSSGCSYCYLEKMGYSNKAKVINTKKAEELIKEIENLHFSKNTLITLGCFSECWDKNNKKETNKLLEYFLENGNQIQIATKKEIFIDELKDISKKIKYYGQLIVFVSSSTISEYNLYEQGTDIPEKRFNTFKTCKYLNIPVVLYMKPIIENITIKDIELYKSFIKKYEIENVVVGSIFGEKKTSEEVHFSNKNLLFYNPIIDEEEIKSKLLELKKIKVFSRSSEVIKYYNVMKK